MPCGNLLTITYMYSTRQTRDQTSTPGVSLVCLYGTVHRAQPKLLQAVEFETFTWLTWCNFLQAVSSYCYITNTKGGRYVDPYVLVASVM